MERSPSLVDRWQTPVLVACALALFTAAWWPVVAGRVVLIGSDSLLMFAPWKADAPGYRQANPLVNDPAQQFLPWQMAVRNQIGHGRVPLWNPDALSGSPLLANDQSAPFSPFTWLALPFVAAVGLSLAMLAKLWVAGIGMVVLLRLLGARGPAAAAGGIGYATSSFMVVWLAFPHTAVAAFLPWTFAAAEWYLERGRALALAALAASVGLQLLGGHAETSLHAGAALALYSAVRWLLGPRDLVRLAGLGLAALLGGMLAAAQILPFLQDLQVSTLVSERARVQSGLVHLDPRVLGTWLVPNLAGNPALDGRLGVAPNYNEGTGFATATLLLLAPLGAVRQWRRERSQAAALLAVGLLVAGTVYGPLTGIVGRLPGLSIAASPRMLVLLCFVVSALGGLGVQAVWESAGRGLRRRLAGLPGLAAGGLAVAALGVAGILLATRGAGVESMWPPVPGQVPGFWTAVAAVALAGAAALAAAGLAAGWGRPAALGLGLLVLGEGALFAVPYEPKTPAATAVPASAVTTWLQEHTSDPQTAGIAALDVALVPNTAALYGLHDARTYDILVSRRSRTYWKAADPDYRPDQLTTVLERPGTEWLALAGVRYYLTGDSPPDGSTSVYAASGMQIVEIPGARPFAWASPAWSAAGSQEEAAALLTGDRAAAPVLEGVRAPAGGGDPSGPPARVDLLTREPGEVDLRVRSSQRQAVVLQQSYDDGWQATIDGRPAPVHPADVQFQAVIVPAGDHRVSLRYRPASFTAGAALGLFALAALAVLAVGGRAWGRLADLVVRTARRRTGGAAPGRTGGPRWRRARRSAPPSPPAPSA